MTVLARSYTIYSNFPHTMKVREDEEEVENNTANNYMQMSDHQHELHWEQAHHAY